MSVLLSGRSLKSFSPVYLSVRLVARQSLRLSSIDHRPSFICLFIFLSIHLSNCLSVYLCIHRFMHSDVHLSVHSSVCLSVYLNVSRSLCLSACLPACVRAHLSLCLYQSVWHITEYSGYIPCLLGIIAVLFSPSRLKKHWALTWNQTWNEILKKLTHVYKKKWSTSEFIACLKLKLINTAGLQQHIECCIPHCIHNSCFASWYLPLGPCVLTVPFFKFFSNLRYLTWSINS